MVRCAEITKAVNGYGLQHRQKVSRAGDEWDTLQAGIDGTAFVLWQSAYSKRAVLSQLIKKKKLTLTLYFIRNVVKSSG